MRYILNLQRLALLAVVAASLFSRQAEAQEIGPPVAAVGHGAFVDAFGRQIVPTEKFIADSILWYRNDVAARVPADRRAINEKQLGEARRSRVLSVNQRLFLEMRSAEWLYANAQRLPADDRNRRALAAFGHVLRFELPRTDVDLYGAYARRVDLGADFESYLQRFGFGSDSSAVVKPMTATTNAGLAYINECRSNGVPIPPPIGDPRWVSRGFIPKSKLFLRNESVEVLTYSSTSPQGLCIALPRSNDTTPSDGVTVVLDGVICLGKQPSPLSGKSSACFWDNQMNGASFAFTKGDRIPIGWNDPAQVSPNPSGRFMSGGAQLTSIGAGMCSDCHAGQNPFVVHPDTVLGQLGKPPLNLPMFGDTWYDPLVLASWPQNEKRLNDVYVPSACQGCHTTGSAGRLPHLSTELNTGPSSYCVTILQNAVRGNPPISPTMPPSSPGSAANAADVKVLVAAPGTTPAPFCNLAATAGPANRGDPHIVSTNGIAFDFQAAGEFIALTEDGGGFELQTRQSPVQTTFTPGANAYTGLASCVALNTAVALRMGKQRVTYQPVGQGDKGGRMQLRIDGKARFLSSGQTLSLGLGNFIADNGSGSLTFGLADGTRVVATPRYWESQGYWYLDIEVLGTTARAGLMGHIGGGEWLPRGGDGSNYGPRPVSLADRATVLHGKFADSWRVTDRTTLFDYDIGQSTKSFTDPAWALSSSCRKSALPAPLVREPASLDAAKLACAALQDKVAREQCIFDVQVMNDTAVVKAYLLTLRQRAALEAAKQ